MSYNRFQDKCYFSVCFTPLATTQLDWADRWWEQTLSVKTTEEQLQAAVNIFISSVTREWSNASRLNGSPHPHPEVQWRDNTTLCQPFPFITHGLIYLFSPQWWEGILCFSDDPITHHSDRSPYTFRGSCRSIVPFTSEPGRVWNNAD